MTLASACNFITSRSHDKYSVTRTSRIFFVNELHVLPFRATNESCQRQAGFPGRVTRWFQQKYQTYLEKTTTTMSGSNISWICFPTENIHLSPWMVQTRNPVYKFRTGPLLSYRCHPPDSDKCEACLANHGTVATPEGKTQVNWWISPSCLLRWGFGVQSSDLGVRVAVVTGHWVSPHPHFGGTTAITSYSAMLINSNWSKACPDQTQFWKGLANSTDCEFP